MNSKLLNGPNAETAKRTRPDEMWSLFVKACGGRCCACSKESLQLHRGHILRHADGGRAIFENLIPLCKSCNSRYKNGFTDDGRPSGWRDRFVKMLLVELQLGIMCKHVETCVDTSKGDKPAETTKLLDLRSVEFVPHFHYKTHPEAASRPMAAAEATKLVWKLFETSKQSTIRPKRPLGKRQDAMKLLAIRHGRDAFMLAGEQFLREEPWIIGNEERGGAYAAQDSWQHLCESFDGYLMDANARAVRLAEQAKAERERELVRQAEAVVYARQMRWNDYIRTANVPSWPGMPGSDAEIIAEIAATKSASTQAQDIDEERYQQSLSVFRRWKHFKNDELLGEKQKLRNKLAQCVVWAKRCDPEMQREFATSIKEHKDWLDREKDVKQLVEHGWLVDELYSTLDPDRSVVAFDPDNF